MRTFTEFSKRMVILFAGIIISTSLFASNPAKAVSENNNKIRSQIVQNLKYPDHCLVKGHSNETAVVTFKLNQDNKVEIQHISCCCKEMKECIEKQLADVYCKDAEHPVDWLYQIRIDFELE
jgi:hypothetical protein